MKRIAIPTLILTLLSILATSSVFAAPRPAQVWEPSREQVREALAKRRAVQLERLRAYRKRMVFPRNRISPQIINVFRDENGLLCAVANLIFLDGDKKLVEDTAKTNNTVKMGTLESGALFEWILASGFTIEEIAAIQLPDSPVLYGGDWERRENMRILAHLARVDKQLVSSADASLELATDRIIAAGNALELFR